MTSNQHDITSPESLARRKQGEEVLTRVTGHPGEAVFNSLADINPALGHHVAAFAFGDIYDRPGLDHRSRQLVTLGVLTALGGTEPQLKTHINVALNVGLTRDEIIEALLQAAVFCGFPRVLNATAVAREVFQARESA